MQGISFTLRPLPPFSLELTVWALRRRPNNEVDRWDGRSYSRIFIFGGNAVEVSVSQEGGVNRPKLYVEAVAETSALQTIRSKVSSTLEKLFSLRRDLQGFYLLSDRDKRLRPLAERFAGVKPT
ncbi:MAG: hypothetical protein ABSA46_17535 [Thermodesulfovibrionales bacterium]|jgi:DNA-3-methyladenine glycosylase II